ncbi:MAG: alpha-galactosidase [Clostridia bacterium]|nr:alpha-galactosidase [Clostridia bacterium]
MNPKDRYTNPAAEEWFRRVTEDFSLFPFAFEYGGRRICGFPAESLTLIERRDEDVDAQRRRVLAAWRAEDGLIVRLDALHDRRFGASEWTVRFENDGPADVALIENPRAVIDIPGGRPVLKGIMGDHVNHYRPYALDVEDMPRYFENNTGRATHVTFPYFNLQHDGGGSMLAIGWAGTWRADFRFSPSNRSTRAVLRSVNGLRIRLRPGESVRTALFVRADYLARGEAAAQNYWRRYFIERNLPRADAGGAALAPFSTACLALDTGRPNSDGSISEGYDTWRPSLQKMLDEDVRVDFRWFDAGWYTAPDGSSPTEDWWGTVGTWTLDERKWPGQTFRESTDFARDHGMKTLMWFEPERVTDPVSLERNWGYRREWGIDYDRRAGVPENRRVVSNNIGDPECFRWTVDRIKKTLSDNRVEMYREDNNSDQAALWRAMDGAEGPNRRGITDCKFIDAQDRMWDEISACTLSYGGCGFVDSCASGGGRNDLESLRRGVPLLRSDDDRQSTGMRLSMTTAFNLWVPFCGAINREKKGQLDARGTLDMYVWRASYLAAMNVDAQYVYDPDQDFSMLRRGLREWKKLAPFILQDMYVLTPWHSPEDTSGFTAYSYYDPARREGAILAFRQENCPESELSVTLPYVGDGEICLLTDEDSGEHASQAGLDMRLSGLVLRMPEKRQARLIWVRVISPEEAQADV